MCQTCSANLGSVSMVVIPNNQARKSTHGVTLLLPATALAHRSLEVIFLSSRGSTTEDDSRYKRSSAWVVLGAGSQREILRAVVISPRSCTRLVESNLIAVTQRQGHIPPAVEFSRRCPHRHWSSLTDEASWRLPLSHHSRLGCLTTNSTRQSSKA
jgi:hypothetical protein